MIEITPKLSLSDDDYRQVIAHYLDDLVGRLHNGDKVLLRDIGTLQVRLTEARQYRHPKTGQSFPKAGGRRLAFKPSRHWRTYDET